MEGVTSSACAGGVFILKGRVKMINYIRENEWLYRSLRTFFQAFVSTVCAQLMLGSEMQFDKKLIFSVITSSFAAGLSAVMNTKKQEGSDDE